MPTQDTDAAPPPPPRPIYVIKKKVAGHGGHHGGAWKVAYADFVTAMMALFIVLWLMSADEEVKQQISSWFNNPTGPGKEVGNGMTGGDNRQPVEVTKEDMAKLREKMEEAIKNLPHFKELKNNVEMTITMDGLRIELLESDAGMFFESGRAAPTQSGAELLTMLADEVKQLPNKLLIEGHTDAKPFAAKGYSNWELSTERANAARRLMEEKGVREDQVAQVRGFAARELRKPDEPEAAQNRRVSVIIQYLAPPKSVDEMTEKGGGKAGEKGKEGEKGKGEQKGSPPGQEAGKSGEAAKKAPEPAKNAEAAKKEPEAKGKH
jgi:chemotaxis protein MotB